MSAPESHVVRKSEYVHRCPQCEHIVKANEIEYSAIARGTITGRGKLYLRPIVLKTM
jgi:hypothetical protein